MEVVRYRPEFYPALRAMLEKQGSNLLVDVSQERLPEIGFVAVLNAEPVAIGFLRRIEGGYAQIDTLATDPEFSSRERGHSIMLIYGKILESAKELGISGLIIITENNSVITRAIDCGFKTIKQTLLGLPLGD
jgi:hypothetical protein